MGSTLFSALLGLGPHPFLTAAPLALPLLLAPAAQAQTVQTLASNIGQANSTANALSRDYANSFTTGSSSLGYSLRSVTIPFAVISNTLSSGNVTVSIRTSSSGNPGSSVVGTLTSPAFTASSSDSDVTFRTKGLPPKLPRAGRCVLAARWRSRWWMRCKAVSLLPHPR